MRLSETRTAIASFILLVYRTLYALKNKVKSIISVIFCFIGVFRKSKEPSTGKNCSNYGQYQFKDVSKNMSLFR